MSDLSRRLLLKQATSGAMVAAFVPLPVLAQERRFEPQPGAWRTFELTTTVNVLNPKGTTHVWLPVPAVDTDYQRSLESSWVGNTTAARFQSDEKYGAKMLHAEFAEAVSAPTVQLTSRVQTRDRAQDWNQRQPLREDAEVLKYWTQPTMLMPTDGIVRKTALDATQGAKTDVDKVRKLYDWVVANTHREPKVRGCGTGDIKTMLETGNMGGKCGDINALFVGLCRAVGVPARDVYGIRLAPSAFGYRELGGNPANLKSAQHCRAEVFLREHGWVAMDPADVGKVMRQETPEWIKDPAHPLVAPVNKALFGGWEGNWLAFNTAHDVALPQAKGGKLGFFMYPNAENAAGRFDSLDPDNFKYTISAREIAA